MSRAPPSSGAAANPGHNQAENKPPPAATPESQTADATAVWQATRTLAQAAQGFVTALLGLLRTEWQLALASWPLLVAILALLVGLSLSLWASLIALLGWGLYLATASVGWSLGALLGLHVVLLLMARVVLKRISRNVTMPATRKELRGLLERARRKQGPG